MKSPGLKPSSNFLPTCAICPYLPHFFPILSIRGSPQFKNGNETWLLYLCPLLASNHGHVVHTLITGLPSGFTLPDAAFLLLIYNQCEFFLYQT